MVAVVVVVAVFAWTPFKQSEGGNLRSQKLNTPSTHLMEHVYGFKQIVCCMVLVAVVAGSLRFRHSLNV